MLLSIADNKLKTLPRWKQGWRAKPFNSIFLCFIVSFIFTGLSAIRNEQDDDFDQMYDEINHDEDIKRGEDSKTSDESSSSSSYGTQQHDDGYLLLCLTDGSIYSVSAWTGSYQTKIRTNPLLQTNHQDNDINSIKNAVIPGLDGRLYWTNEQTQQLHELPLTIHSLLENPVRSCDPYHPEVDCGILTAEAETSLLALSPNGKLIWKTTESNDANNDEDDNNPDDTNRATSTSKQLQALGTQPALFLQRKDYWVQHVLASTGRQSWNVSLGTYQALDFGPEDSPDENTFDNEPSWNNKFDNNNDEEEYLFREDIDEGLLTTGVNVLEDIVGHRHPNEKEWHSKQHNAKLRQIQLQKKKKRHLLPSVHFSNSGHTLTAIHPISGDVLWRQDVPSVLSSVFGIHNGQWRTLEVLENRDDLFEDDKATHYQDENSKNRARPQSEVRNNPLLLADSENGVESAEVATKEKIRKLFNNHDYYYQQILWQQYQKRPNGLDEVMRNQHQQKINNPNNENIPLLLLPSGLDNTDNNRQEPITNKKVDQTCSALPHGILKNRRSCPVHGSPILELPGPTTSPPRSSKPSKVGLQSQPEGLLLSWTVVCVFIVIILASIVGFYFWYRQKKANWINESDSVRQQQNGNQYKFELSDTKTAASTVSFETESFGGFQKTRTQSVGSPLIGSQQSLLKRSLSLPGTWNDNGLGKQAIHNVDKSPNLAANNIVGGGTGNNSSKLSDFTLPESAVNNQTDKRTPGNSNDQSASSATVGGFPLVQYSRYASEFQESRPMGKGGFGTVFCCTNVLDGRDYAIKKVSITSSAISTNNAKSSTAVIFQQQLQRVLREVKVLAVLDHPNIVRYYTAWLEIMKDDEEDSNKRSTEVNRSRKLRSDDYTGEVSSASSHCYSSSLLLASDSVSQWDVSGRGKRFTSARNFRPMVASRQKQNPLGWDGTGFLIDESGSSDQESFSRYQRSPSLPIASSTDDYLIFEDDDNYVDEEQSSSHNNQENTIPTSTGFSFRKGLHRRSKSDSASSNESLLHDDKMTSATSHMHRSNNSDLHKFDKEDNGVRHQAFIDSTMLNSSKSTVSNRVSIESKETGRAQNHRLNSQVDTDISSAPNSQKTKVRHTLYIQMELCSHKTVADFLQDPDLRCVGRLSAIHSSSVVETSNKGHIDIPKALRLFLQIAEAVKHVHNQGLIHRDLKPSNCFLNEPHGGATTVKVGDFGLSRHEHASNSTETDTDDFDSRRNGESSIGLSEDHTAGVGTRLYASPEQMNGSDYDSSTDVFSLGIILFELLYPMYTGMERNICLSRLRESLTFPADWHTAIGNAFPDLEDMIRRMVRREPSNRPTAESVARHVSSILGEFTVLALDLNHNSDPEVYLLRVEAEHRDDTLGHTMRLIHEIASSFSLRDCSSCSNQVTIVQYGLRSSSSSSGNNGKSSSIMEFAIKFNNVPCNAATNSDEENEVSPKNDCQQENSILFSRLVGKLMERPGIYKARQISCASSS